MKKNTVYFMIAAFFLMSIVACAPQGSVRSVQMPDESPQDVVQSFYDEIRMMESSLLVNDAYKKNPYFNTDGVKYIESVVARFGPGGAADPFVCAQDMPNAFFAGEAEIIGTEAIVEVESDWGTRTIVTLTVTNGEWKISKIECVR
jgi:hypothetical protein